VTKPSVIALIPCRLDSSRLPGKALLDVAGKPAIVRLIDQVERSAHLSRSDIVICTTERQSDDALVDAVIEAGARIFRGNTDDLVDRLYHATVAHPSSVVAQIDGDDLCPDPGYLDLALEAVNCGECDVAFTGNGLPLGSGTKAFKSKCLEHIYQQYVPGKNDTGFGYYLTRSGLFTVKPIEAQGVALTASDIRLTLDYQEDLELFRQIYRASDDAGMAPSVGFIMSLISDNPELAKINAGLDEKYWERTKEIIDKNPLQLRVNGEIRNIGAPT
jgi:spore coat polysaccharide biosynthesis protein SpsF